MPDCTVREKILLHLSGYEKYREEKYVPYRITQAGIAEVLDVSHGHVSKVIQRIKEREEDILEEKIRHVNGLKRKRKVYFLTKEGHRKECKIRERLKEKQVKIKDKNGIKKVLLQDVERYLDSREPLIEAVVRIDEEGVLDLTKTQEERDLFVGRKKEINKLIEELKNVKLSNSNMIFIKGEAGIGKTRLVNEFRKKAVKEGFDFLYGNSYVESSDSYLPIKEALDRYLKNLSEEKQEEYQNLPFITPTNGFEIEDKNMFDEKRKSTFYRTTDFVKNIAEKKPIVFFLDDLQWADKATLDLLYYMMNKSENIPVLFIGTYRPEDVSSGDSLREMLQRASREDLFDKIELEKLSKEETSKILEGLLGRSDVPVKLVDIVYTKTEGNPLFIRECIKVMKDEGSIDPKKGKYPIKEEDVKIPEIITNIINRRIERLDKDTRRILEISSVIGSEVHFNLLRDVVNEDEFKLLEYIDTVLSNNIWYEEFEEEKFYFTHSLILDCVYSNMTKLRKKKIHKKVAEKMEELWKEDLEEDYTDLALHYYKAGVYSKALKYYLKAGEYAKSVYAHDNAIEFYERALELSEKTDEGVDKNDIYVELGDTLKIIGEYDKSREYFEKAMMNTPDLEEQQCLYRKIAKTYLIQSRYKKAINFIEQGLKINKDPNKEKGALLRLKGWIFVKQGEYDESQKIFEKEKEVVDKVGGIDQKSEVMHDLGSNALFKHEYDKAIERFEKVIEILEDHGNKMRLASTYNNLGIVYINIGDFEKANHYHKKGLEIWEEIGYKNGMAATLTNIGIIKENKGELDEAIVEHKETKQIYQQVGNKSGIANSLFNLGKLYRKKGQLDESLEYLEESRGYREEINDNRGLADILNDMGLVYLYKNDLSKSEELLKKSLKVREDIKDKLGVITALHNIGTLYWLDRDFERSKSYFEDSLQICKEIGNHNWKVQNLCKLIEVSMEIDEDLQDYIDELKKEDIDTVSSLYHYQRAMGLINKSEDSWDDAKNKLMRALDNAEKIDEKTKIGISLFDLSELYEEIGDLDKSLEYCKESKDIFSEGGIEIGIERCKERLNKL